MSDVTQILHRVEQGDRHAASELLPLVYEELRKLAAAKMAHERPGQTLDATSLVHEAYLRLVSADAPADPQQPRWDGRGHFFAAAAEAMRRILVDNARRKGRPKHGGDRQRLNLDDNANVLAPSPADDLVALDEALTRLAAEEPAKAQLVTMRYFAGLTLEESAAAMNISPATAKRYWAYARAWLYDALSENDTA